jgi:hypothetical protein
MSLVEVTTPSGKKKTVGIAQDQSGSVLTIVVLGATGDLAKKVGMRLLCCIAYALHAPLVAHFPCSFCSIYIETHAREISCCGCRASARCRQTFADCSWSPRASLLKCWYFQGCR